MIAPSNLLLRKRVSHLPHYCNLTSENKDEAMGICLWTIRVWYWRWALFNASVDPVLLLLTQLNTQLRWTHSLELLRLWVYLHWEKQYCCDQNLEIGQRIEGLWDWSRMSLCWTWCPWFTTSFVSRDACDLSSNPNAIASMVCLAWFPGGVVFCFLAGGIFTICIRCLKKKNKKPKASSVLELAPKFHWMPWARWWIYCGCVYSSLQKEQKPPPVDLLLNFRGSQCRELGLQSKFFVGDLLHSRCIVSGFTHPSKQA